MAHKDDKTTVLFTNEAMNDAINFKEIIPNMHYAYQKENLNEYYKWARTYLNHNQHIISKQSNKDILIKLRTTLDSVQVVLFNNKPRIKQKQVAYAEQRAEAFAKVEKVVLYINQELQKIGYFKKSITSSGDIMDEYFKNG